MHKPQIALIVAKRTAAGGDLPDFGGEGFRDARSAAVSPCGHADHAAAEPEPERDDFRTQLAKIKRAVSEVQSAVAALDSSPEPEPEGSSPDGEDEPSYGEAHKL